MASNANERDTARPRFYKDAVQNMAASETEGRPIFEEKEMVEVKIPGDKLFSWIGEVEDRHKHRWLDHYAAFKRGEERAATGTPLEQWPNAYLNKSRVAELKAQNVLSVEELANIPDNALSKLGMGSRDLREQARSYIETAKSGAETSKMAAEIAHLRDMVERLSSGGVSPAPVIEAPAPTEKPLEDCTDQELKDFIKRETGEAPRANTGRETLLKKAADIAQRAEAA